MSLRNRFFVLVLLILLLPFGVAAFVMRSEVKSRLQERFFQRAESVTYQARADLERRGESLATRLERIRDSIVGDNDFRRAVVDQDQSRTRYRIELAERLMQIAGLSVLSILDSSGTVLSSGHFPNAFGEPDSRLLRLPTGRAVRPVLVRTIDSSGKDLLPLAKRLTFRMGEADYSIVGGVELDGGAIADLDEDRDVEIQLTYPHRLDPKSVWLRKHLSAVPTASDFISGIGSDPEESIDLFYLEEEGDLQPIGTTRLTIGLSPEPFENLLERFDLTLGLFLILLLIGAILVAYWVSGWVAHPLGDLAERVRWVNLERPRGVDFRTDRKDEIGELSRFLGDMTDRLATSTTQLVDSERRAAYGDLARKVKHDLVNKFVPIRNVVQHLVHVAKEQPQELASQFGSRVGTIQTGLNDVDKLARGITRLYGEPDRSVIDLNDLIVEQTEWYLCSKIQKINLNLSRDRLVIRADPTDIRRIMDNLVRNAIESYEGMPGRVVIETKRIVEGESVWAEVRVIDSGKGMTPEQIRTAFDVGVSTKKGERGFGLANVDELRSRNDGTVSILSEVGEGTQVTVRFPFVDDEVDCENGEL